MARIAIVLNASWNIVNFRLPLLRHLEQAGHDIIAMAPRDDYTDRIPHEFLEVPMRSNSKNPLQHLGVRSRLLRAFRKARPDIALLYTIQPNVHGNLAAARSGVRTISNVAGLGSLFTRPGLSTRVARGLYRRALDHASTVFFQNEDDQRLFLDAGLVQADIARRIPGSGIDLARFSSEPPARAPGAPFVFLMASRLLRDKGVAEYCAAARRIRATHPKVEFRLLGPLGVDSPGSLNAADLESMLGDAVTYGGVSDAIEQDLAQAHVAVLPTRYREGVPRFLLEAAAMARPIVATDVVGCRDVVSDGVNGVLVEPGSVDALEAGLRQVLAWSEEAFKGAGQASRRLAETRFDQALVFEAYDQAIGEILPCPQK